MLVIKLEVWPHGDEASAREISRMEIGHVKEGVWGVADYDVILRTPGEEQRRASVHGHFRSAGAWSLVKLAMEALSL